MSAKNLHTLVREAAFKAKINLLGNARANKVDGGSMLDRLFLRTSQLDKLLFPEPIRPMSLRTDLSSIQSHALVSGKFSPALY
jgi:hypothetical protein